MRVLLVSGEVSLAQSLKQVMCNRGHAVAVASSEARVALALRTQSFELVLLDLASAEGACELVGYMRQQLPRAFLMTVARSDCAQERVRILNAGADDCLPRPYSLDEILAKLDARARREFGCARRVVTFGELRYDVVDRAVYLGSRLLKLSKRDVTILEALMRRAGQFVNKFRLLERMRESGCELTANALEVSIYRLRKRLSGCGVHVSTMRGLGYCLEVGEQCAELLCARSMNGVVMP